LNSPRTALLTGAGREPARSLALALAACGWNLALNDLVPTRLDETARLARAAGAGGVSTHIGDASKGLFARGLVEEALDAWGQIDALINFPMAEPRLSLLDLDEWDFQRTLEANIHGPFLLIQLVGNWLRNEKHPGVMINLISGPMEPPAQAGREAYYTSQMGLRALTASAAPGLAEYNVNIYGICLGANQPETLVMRALSLLESQAQVPTGTILQF
jgi:3-oxoacyl-[acyl-carrier protein] reductase